MTRRVGCVTTSAAWYNANPAFGEVDVARLVYVAPTDAQAKAESEVGVVRHVKSPDQGDCFAQGKARGSQ